MKVDFSWISLLVGSCGLSVSSYLLYKDAKKQKWAKAEGYIDNVTLKYISNFLQGAFYIDVDYYCNINEKRINGRKKYKICATLLESKPGESDAKRRYVQNLFEQVGKTKSIFVAYDPENWQNTDPLIYIYDNEIIKQNTFFYKWKKKIGITKEVLLFWKNADQQKEIENAKRDKIENDTKKNEKKENINHNYNRTDISEPYYNKSEMVEPHKKKLINSYDINSMFPIYMFCGSFFLILSFFLKRRIHYVRKELSLKQKDIHKTR